jgi:hypothetical protein
MDETVVDEGAQAPSDANTEPTSNDQWVVDTNPLPFDLEGHKRLLIDAVDDYVATVYSRFMRFDMEYVKREEAARSFVAAAYEGDPGIWVSAFATGAGIPTNIASDLIIQQADQLRTALETLGALRMTKYGITKAATKEDADAVKESIFASIEAIAANL